MNRDFLSAGLALKLSASSECSLRRPSRVPLKISSERKRFQTKTVTKSARKTIRGGCMCDVT